jgi:hypothetical protein
VDHHEPGHDEKQIDPRAAYFKVWPCVPNDHGDSRHSTQRLCGIEAVGRVNLWHFVMSPRRTDSNAFLESGKVIHHKTTIKAALASAFTRETQK